MTVKHPWSTNASDAQPATPHSAPPDETSQALSSHNNNNPTLNASPTKISHRPKSVSQWSVVDVQKWFRRNCGDYYHHYSEKFLEQDITGRSLLRLSENSLLRLGIVHPQHREDIWREITKLRLRTNILILRDLEQRQK